MKKNILICLAASLLAVGCTHVHYTSKGAYLGAMHDVELDMQTLGYYPVATGHETVNEAYLTEEDVLNGWMTYDTRQFVDSLGNTAAYSVGYRKYEDGMRNVAVAGCEVSHPGYYTAICGDDGVVQHLNNVPIDKKGEMEMTLTGLLTLVLGAGVMLPILIASIIM